jgi:preprotein translocase subunit SecG
MIYIVVAIHVIVCIFLVIVVLLQSGKSADVAAAFGGMGSQTAFGPRSAANVLTKATTWSAVLFMVTSITLSVMMSRHSSNSVMQGVKAPKQTTAPAQPGAPSKGSNTEPQPVTR